MNHGKESSKFNQDCAICRTCRPTIPDAAVLKGRGNGIQMAGMTGRHLEPGSRTSCLGSAPVHSGRHYLRTVSSS